MELRKLEKYADAHVLLKFLANKYPKFEQIQWEIAFTSIVEVRYDLISLDNVHGILIHVHLYFFLPQGVNVLPSANMILQASRSNSDLPYGMIDISAIELLNNHHYNIITDLEPRSAILAVVRYSFLSKFFFSFC